MFTFVKKIVKKSKSADGHACHNCPGPVLD